MDIPATYGTKLIDGPQWYGGAVVLIPVMRSGITKNITCRFDLPFARDYAVSIEDDMYIFSTFLKHYNARLPENIMAGLLDSWRMQEDGSAAMETYSDNFFEMDSVRAIAKEFDTFVKCLQNGATSELPKLVKEELARLSDEDDTVYLRTHDFMQLFQSLSGYLKKMTELGDAYLVGYMGP